jgi:hypothetical protein
MQKDVSTNLPFTFPAKAARAKPAPILAATSAIVTDCSKERIEPSGNLILGMADL